MAKRLRNLRIDDVSSVDVGAGRGVRVVLHKRDTATARDTTVRKWRDGVPAIYGKPIVGGVDLSAEAIAYLKKDYSDDQRQEMAGSGEAQDDGSYPIKNTTDLHNAIQAIGRSKNPAKTKAHIKRRARALGATDKLPEDWTSKAFSPDEDRDEHGKWVAGGRKAEDLAGKHITYQVATSDGTYHQNAKVQSVTPEGKLRVKVGRYPQDVEVGDVVHVHKRMNVVKIIGLVNKAIVEGVRKNAVDFSEAIEAADNVQDACDLMGDVRDAVCALDTSINSILCDEDVADKAAAITESYGQFKTYLESLQLEDDGDADDQTKKRDDDMSGLTALNPQLQRVIAEEVAKAVGAKDDTISKLEAQVSYLKMKKEHQAYHDGLGSDAEKKKFTSMTDDERDDEMNKTRKRAEDDPIYKAMRAQNEDLQKRLQAIEDERALEVAKRDAKAMGLTQNDAGEVLMKMRRGDAAAIKTYEAYMVALSKAQNKQIDTSKLFDEFGTSRGNDGTSGDSAHDQLVVKAQELRKTQPNLSEAQAFDKVYNDPANRELRNQERAQHFAKLGVRVA